MSAQESGNASESILNSCRKLVNLIHTASKSTERSLGISVAQHFVLQKLADGKPRSISELARLTHTHQSSVSAVVKKLVAQKYLKSLPNEEDARRHEIRITAKGSGVLDKFGGLHVQDQIIGATGRLSLEDRLALASLLTKLLAEVELGREPPSMFLED